MNNTIFKRNFNGTYVNFKIEHGDSNEIKEMVDRENNSQLTCWFCDRKTCFLTHKGEDYSNAKYPDRNPYKYQ